jgi:hypothetical protein
MGKAPSSLKTESLKTESFFRVLEVLNRIEQLFRDERFCTITGYMDDLLCHLIVRYAERRLTRSGESGIRNTVDKILRSLRCRSLDGGFYLDREDLKSIIEESWLTALRNASFHAFEGRYTENELAEKLDASQIRKEALQLVIDRMKETTPLS